MCPQKAKAEPEQKETRRGLRQREKEVVPCEMCHARVRRPQMGKHLLSHYHCRVAGASPYSPNARRFLLENMANVVRQCSFQCASCRFYCNSEETFLLHWRSDLHARTLEQVSRRWSDSSDVKEPSRSESLARAIMHMLAASVGESSRRSSVTRSATIERLNR